MQAQPYLSKRTIVFQMFFLLLGLSQTKAGAQNASPGFPHHWAKGWQVSGGGGDERAQPQ